MSRERRAHHQSHQHHSTRLISRGTKDKKVKTISMAPNLSPSAFAQLASEKQIEKTVQALQAHGIRVVVVETGEEARTYVLDLIPDGAEVFNSQSRTLELIGLAEQIQHATHFQSVRARLQLYALYEGAVIGLPFFHLGVAWFIPTLYVPLLLVSHVIVFWVLLRAAPSTQVGRASAALDSKGEIG
jgi:hypothetical protein